MARILREMKIYSSAYITDAIFEKIESGGQVLTLMLYPLNRLRGWIKTKNTTLMMPNY